MTDVAREYMNDTESVNKNSSDLFGKVAYAVGVGVGGTVLIVLFLSTLMHPFTVLKFIPWLIAFNTAVTGYSLIDKTQDRLKHKDIASIGAGILNVIITYLTLVLIYFFFVGGYLFTKWDPILYLTIGIVCSKLGALLAFKYQNIKKEHN